eukprot:6965884-Karenia_brevis.AAC.1
MGKPSSQFWAQANPRWLAGLQLLQVIQGALGGVGFGGLPMVRAGCCTFSPNRLSGRFSGSRFSDRGKGSH